MVIASSVLTQILAEAAAAPDREVCGLLLGDVDAIMAARAAANVADDPSRTFEVDPRALFAALRDERAGGAKVIGHYHSHPNGVAAPSARDAGAAEPGWLWMIAAAGEATLWMAEEEGRFRNVAFEVGRDDARGAPSGCATGAQTPQGPA
jgi:proteasome lid subunit RPN8/RPN11